MDMANNDWQSPDALDPSLIVTPEITVRPEWIDTNNHLNVAYYVKTFAIGTGVLFDRVGLDDKDMAERGTSTFAAEMNVSYKREVRLGDTLMVATQLIGFDSKRIHYYSRIYQRNDGYLAATLEALSLHVSMESRRVCPIGADSAKRLADLAASQAHLPRPENLGRTFAVKQQ